MNLETLSIKNIVLDNFCTLSNENVEMLRLWRNSPEVRRFMFTQNEITIAQQDDFINSLRIDKSKQYFLARLKGEPIGSIYFFNIDFENQKCFWGYYLNPKIIGVAYGLVLEYTVAEVAFEILRLEKLLCEGFVSNTTAVKIHREFGFEEMKNDGGIVLMELRKEIWNFKRNNVELLISKFIS